MNRARHFPGATVAVVSFAALAFGGCATNLRNYSTADSLQFSHRLSERRLEQRRAEILKHLAELNRESVQKMQQQAKPQGDVTPVGSTRPGGRITHGRSSLNMQDFAALSQTAQLSKELKAVEAEIQEKEREMRSIAAVASLMLSINALNSSGDSNEALQRKRATLLRRNEAVMRELSQIQSQLRGY